MAIFCQRTFTKKFSAVETLGSDAPFYVHSHALPRPQGDALQRHDGMALDQIEAKSAQKMGEQNDPLLDREGHADAHARASAERDVGETVDALALFAQESGRIE